MATATVAKRTRKSTGAKAETAPATRRRTVTVPKPASNGKPKAAAAVVKAAASAKMRFVNLVNLTKETKGAFQYKPSDKDLAVTGDKSPLIVQAYIRKSLVEELSTQKTVDLKFTAGRVKGASIQYSEIDRKGKEQGMQTLYLLADAAGRLNIDAESAVKVRVEKLPADKGFKLTVQAA